MNNYFINTFIIYYYFTKYVLSYKFIFIYKKDLYNIKNKLFNQFLLISIDKFFIL